MEQMSIHFTTDYSDVAVRGVLYFGWVMSFGTTIASYCSSVT
jgi:hypothetical protein